MGLFTKGQEKTASSTYTTIKNSLKDAWNPTDQISNAVQAFLIAFSRLPGAKELAEKTLNAGDEG